MIPKSCKRLAEVDFPIAAVSKHAAREKSIRHGHPSTLHLWWARRPLAACRAMLMALLLPDPCDAECPEDFLATARPPLLKMRSRPMRWEAEVGTPAGLRKVILEFLADFANWDNSADRDFLEAARALVKAAHPEETPLVVDPFAGGGSIPLEALRLGCEAFASDLNPVACLILKTMLEDVPRHGPELADELRRVGAEVKAAAEKELAEFYPLDPDGAKPIAYLWARTVRCEAPNCGAEIPLVRSFWLCKKAKRRRALKAKVMQPKGETPSVEFEIFEPAGEEDVPEGTVSRAKAKCLCCGTVLAPNRVRAQLREQHGGADVVFDKEGTRTGGARLLAVATLKPGETGRAYRLPTEQDYELVWKARECLERATAEPLPSGLSRIPNETTPAGGGSGAGRAFAVQNYGMMTFGDMFTVRQKLVLATLCTMVQEVEGNSSAVKGMAALALSRFTDICNAFCRWESSKTQVRNLFTRPALGMMWDFAEPGIFGDQAGDYTVTAGSMARVVDAIPAGLHPGQVQTADACDHPLPGESVAVWFTDPPYYDAIPYSDLSDFFFVWLRRVLPAHPLLCASLDGERALTPKEREAVQDELRLVDGRPKDRGFFEEAMARAFAEGRRTLKEDGVGSVVFAHKTTEGWEALLTGMIRGGWVITGSWPIATESGTCLRARDSAALATSVHLVCRPRTEDKVGDWGEVLGELPGRVGDWMERLQAEKVRGADLVFACIGPALEIFSRYSRVETADDPPKVITLAEYLEKVWEVVGRLALEHILGTAEAKARNGAAGALEEDARLTALFLWALQTTEAGNGPSPRPSPRGRGSEGEGDDDGAEGELAAAAAEDSEDYGGDEDGSSKPKKTKGFSLIYDVVRRFSQPLGIHLEAWEGRIIETDKGVVRLLSIGERAKQLFGDAGAEAMARRIEDAPPEQVQTTMFGAPATEAPEIKVRKGRGRKKAGSAAAAAGEAAEEKHSAPREATTLDRVHAAMLLQASGRANALRALLVAEQDRGPDFLRLANALSALYPAGSEEKRLLDAMLLAVPR